VLPVEGQSLILAGALISIALNPLVFEMVEPAQAWIRARSQRARKLELRDDPLAELPASVASSTLTGHIVLAGYGRVGRHIAEALDRQGQPYVVAEQQREAVEKLRGRGIHAVVGDASEPAVLIQAHVARAQMLVIATPDAFRARKMFEIARMLNPRIRIVVRSHSADEAELLRREQAVEVLVGEQELANSMVRLVSQSAGAHATDRA
jgi:CPA2 family monovalent cation:H+ antiporter-2